MIDLRTNCVLHCKMNDNDASTDVVNTSGDVNGTFSTGTDETDLFTEERHSTGKTGGALHFNDSYLVEDVSYYINCNFSYKTAFDGSFSANFWAKSVAINNGTVMAFDNTVGLDKHVSVDISMQFLSMNYNDGTQHTFLKSIPTIPPELVNVWSMFTVVAEQIGSDVNVRLYTNGSEVLNETVNDFDLSQMSIGWPDYAYGNLFIGAYNAFVIPPGIAVEGFGGDLDEVTLFNKALSTAEIAFLYNGGAGTESLYDLPVFSRYSLNITTTIDIDAGVENYFRV